MSDTEIKELKEANELKETKEVSRLLPFQEARVVMLLLPQVNLLDLAGPAQVFHSANTLSARYRVEFCSLTPIVPTAQGLNLANLAALPELNPPDRLIIPGLDLDAEHPEKHHLPEAIREWLQRQAARGVHIASVCTGAFVLGEAGLLDGKRCTTHWFALDILQARYPHAQVLNSALFVHDQNITTSAGIASGIDMALDLVAQDYGPLFTAQVARYLVVYLRRNGTQPQHSIYLEYRTHFHTGVHAAQDYLINNLSRIVPLAELAENAAMSVRNLTRAFKEATGLSPLQYHQRLRLAFAANLLGSSNLSVEEIALQAGFEDVRHFRRLWQREFGSPPSTLRSHEK